VCWSLKEGRKEGKKGEKTEGKTVGKEEDDKLKKVRNHRERKEERRILLTHLNTHTKQTQNIKMQCGFSNIIKRYVTVQQSNKLESFKDPDTNTNTCIHTRETPQQPSWSRPRLEPRPEQ
jgi:hypothetical protein